MRVTVFGATGYAGAILTDLLVHHPHAELVGLFSSGKDQSSLQQHYPGFHAPTDLLLDCCPPEEAIAASDLIFLALPHGKGMDLVASAHNAGKRVIDLSGDHRLNQPAAYEEWYGFTHPRVDLLKESVYGLPELHSQDIRSAALVANPGCYPTSVLLGLAPLQANCKIKSGSIVIHSMSGVSGAGKSSSFETSFVEVDENLKAYRIFSHQHTPEIEQELEKLSNAPTQVVFSPHLVPVKRGILSTISLMPEQSMTDDELRTLYVDFYKNAPFVKLMEPGILPQTKWVSGSNYCYLGLSSDPRTGAVMVVSAIDNLMKGAAGQAIQNMNLMFGLPETTGLIRSALIP